ncbi:MAG: hypothetical protein HPY45_17865 [Anaerolineae bacterium]|nr:hypothetical protein [Anaerolineae bacterium]
MENKVVKIHPRERGQAIALFALFTMAMALLALAALDYAVSSARTMETVAAADLAAHAGAMEVKLLPNGKIENRQDRAEEIAARYFNAQRPRHASLSNVRCGAFDGRPGCMVEAVTRSPGMFLFQREIQVQAIGYLAYGVLRDDQ